MLGGSTNFLPLWIRRASAGPSGTAQPRHRLLSGAQGLPYVEWSILRCPAAIAEYPLVPPPRLAAPEGVARSRCTAGLWECQLREWGTPFPSDLKSLLGLSSQLPPTSIPHPSFESLFTLQ